jgi:peptidoglycan LD-endopeptidase LytH
MSSRPHPAVGHVGRQRRSRRLQVVSVVVGFVLASCSSASQKAVTTTAPPPRLTVAAPTATTATLPATTTTVALLDRILAAPTDEVEHAYPVAADVTSSYARTHSGYPAADVFAACGSEVLAMATGVVQHVRSSDTYDKKIDNPALRGGKSVSVVGLDGVRYYTSHLDRLDVTVGQPVTAGDVLGTIGLTGDSEACHTHVGISPLCPTSEWSVRRGVIWPWPYFEAWRKGLGKEPLKEIAAWLTSHPDSCDKAAQDPNAAD